MSRNDDLAGTSDDLTIGSMSYNPASQIMSQQRSNDSFAWTGHGNGSTAGVANGLNQLTSIGGSATAHDSKGNLTSDPTTGKTYGYSSENLLTSASGGVSLGYDPGMRLYQVAGAATTRFAYDGIDMIAEYDGSNALQRRFIHGPGMDAPLVQYEGSGTTDRRFLQADERGSIIAISDASANLLTTNRYDEFGKPQSTNAGRFQYTGQMWIGELGAYYYKARIYSPSFSGRFLQTDPIGYAGDGPNMYAYVLNDPVNLVDPLGLEEHIYVAATAPRFEPYGSTFGGMLQGFSTATTAGTVESIELGTEANPEHVTVTAKPKESKPVVIRQLWRDFVRGVSGMLCKLPPIGGGGGADMYAVAGGSMSGGAALNPGSGQLSISFDLGVGLGVGGGTRILGGKALGIGGPSSEKLPIVTAGLNANATAAVGLAGAAGSYQIIGATPGDWSLGATGGATATANANVSAHVQLNLQLYDPGCEL